jgi:hypothetical protein
LVIERRGWSAPLDFVVLHLEPPHENAYLPGRGFRPSRDIHRSSNISPRRPVMIQSDSATTLPCVGIHLDDLILAAALPALPAAEFAPARPPLSDEEDDDGPHDAADDDEEEEDEDEDEEDDEDQDDDGNDEDDDDEEDEDEDEDEDEEEDKKEK